MQSIYAFVINPGLLIILTLLTNVYPVMFKLDFIIYNINM